jgi:uncharacterized membrane protein HdeD (DUF308 family)
MISFNAANNTRSIFRGVITLIVGIVLIFVPSLTLKTVIQLLGGLLLLDGFVNFLIQTFSKREQQSIFMINRGMPNLIFGVILISFPESIVKVFVFLIGFFLIVVGFSLVMSQFKVKKLKGLTLVFFILGILSTLAGFAMLTKPFQSAQAMMIFLGIVVSLIGIGQVLWTFKVRKQINRQQKQEPQTIDTDYEVVD